MRKLFLTMLVFSDLSLFLLGGCSAWRQSQQANAYIAASQRYVADATDLAAFHRAYPNRDISKIFDLDTQTYSLLSLARDLNYAPAAVSRAVSALDEYETALAREGIFRYAHSPATTA